MPITSSTAHRSAKKTISPLNDRYLHLIVLSISQISVFFANGVVRVLALARTTLATSHSHLWSGVERR
jgi:hypothetical protein